MKILQVVNSLSAGGAEVFVTQLSVALSKICDVEVFTFYGVLDKKGEALRELLLTNNIPFSQPEHVNKGTLKKIMCPFQLQNKINETKPDVVHVHLDQCELFAYLASFLPGHKAKHIRTIHNIKRSKRVPKVLWRSIDDFFNYSIHCSTASSSNYEYLGKLDSYLSIDNGILLPNICSQQDSSKYPSDTIRLLNIGSFSKRFNVLQKGQDILIEALPGLRDLPLQVVFVGDGEEKEILTRRADELEVLSMTEFAGQVTDPYLYIKSVDALIMPSRFEGLPISTIEAVCSGLPLIASDIPAFNSFNSDSTIYFCSESISAIQGAIRHFINNLTMFKNQASINADYYRTRFDIRNVAEKYYDIFLTQIFH